MVLHTDHWLLKPSVWATIPEPRQEKILEDMMDLAREGVVYGAADAHSLRTGRRPIHIISWQVPPTAMPDDDEDRLAGNFSFGPPPWSSPKNRT